MEKIFHYIRIFFLYANTIRHLKAKQIFFRLVFKVSEIKIHNVKNYKRRMESGDWSTPIIKKNSLLSKRTFNFLNQTGDLELIGWDGDQVSKLWRYNQHYFDFINASKSGRSIDDHSILIRDWVEKHPLTKDSRTIGWDPYPTSLRAVNLIKWVLNGSVLSKDIESALFQHGNLIYQRLEWHIMGNHLFANAKALIFLGSFFEGDIPDRWLQKGISIIKKELKEQILNDGGHFERSPMYHCVVLEDILDLINLSGHYNSSFDKSLRVQLKNAAEKMLYWLRALLHPDGQIAFFNDASIGVAAEAVDLFDYAKRLKLRIHEQQKKIVFPDLLKLEDSGFLHIETASSMVFMDVGSIAPSYQPGHAHAGTLSFELSINGSRVIVNSGTSTYDNNEIRHKERSTAAHNTVAVNERNSSEVWSSFRVARRATVTELYLRKNENSVKVLCSHDGYKRLFNGVVHSRACIFEERKISILDNLEGKFQNATAHYHLHPDISIKKLSPSHYMLMSRSSGTEINFIIHEGLCSICDSHYAPEFGKRMKSKKLIVDFRQAMSFVTLTW